MLVPRPDQTSGNSLVLTFSLVASFDGKALDGNGAGGLSPTPDRTECISVHEYSNSCPHFKHTSYVRLLMVNTPLRLEGGTQRTHKSCARWRCSQVAVALVLGLRTDHESPRSRHFSGFSRSNKAKPNRYKQPEGVWRTP